MKRAKLHIEVDASCENCAFSYLDEATDEFICSKSMPHQEVEEDNHCDSWKLKNHEEGFECLIWSNVKLIK